MTSKEVVIDGPAVFELHNTQEQIARQVGCLLERVSGRPCAFALVYCVPHDEEHNYLMGSTNLPAMEAAILMATMADFISKNPQRGRQILDEQVKGNA